MLLNQLPQDYSTSCPCRNPVLLPQLLCNEMNPTQTDWRWQVTEELTRLFLCTSSEQYPEEEAQKHWNHTVDTMQPGGTKDRNLYQQTGWGFFFFFIACVLVVTFPSMQTQWPGQHWQYVHKHNYSLIKCRIVLCTHWYVGREATGKKWRIQMSETLCVKTNCTEKQREQRSSVTCATHAGCWMMFTVRTLVLLLFMLVSIFNIFKFLSA